MEEITASWVRGRLPRRDPMGHKGTFGKVLCICGSVGFSGAAVFAGRAAVRTGSGLVYLGVPEPVWPVAAAKCDEVILVGRRHTQPILEGLRAAGMDEAHIHVTGSLTEATGVLGKIGLPGDVVLFENDLPDNYNEKE